MIQRDHLSNILSAFFDRIHFDRKSQDSYYNFMKHRNVNIGRFNGIVLGMIELNTLSDEELFWFAEFPGVKVNVADYFSDKEIRKYSKSRTEKQSLKYPIVLENVLQIDVDQWVTTIKTQDLCKLYNNNLLVYNPATQRNPKSKEINGQTVYRININRQSVAQIKSLLERNLFIPNDISLNIRGSFKCDGDSIIIEDDGMDVIDGFHRLMAIIELTSQNPDYNNTFILNLMYFSEEKAKRYIAQQDKRNKINKSYSRTLDNTRYENLIVTRLNEDPDSCFYGRIKPFGENRIDSGKMIEAVGYLFRPKNNSDVGELEQKIRDGLNAIVKAHPAIEESFDDADMRVALCGIKHGIPTSKFMKNRKEYRNLKSVHIIDKKIGGAA